MADAATLRRDYDALLDQASMTFREWQTISEFLLPRKSNITQWQTPGGRQTTRMFDSIGPHSVQTLAASLGGTLTSPAQKWFSLVIRQKELLDQHDVGAWLEEVADRVYLALNQSNFVAEINEVYVDLACFGTGAILCHEKEMERANVFAGLEFEAFAPGSYVIAEGADGRVDTFFYRKAMSVSAAKAQWGDKIGASLLRLAEQKPYEQIAIVHAIYPRKGQRKGYDKLGMPFESCKFVVGKGPLGPGMMSGPQDIHVIEESGYPEFPGAIPRWTKTSGETYGRGPGHTALPDIRSLNQATRQWLAANEKAIDPPLMQLEDAVLGELSLNPAAINIVSQLPAVAPIESAQRREIAMDMFARLEAKIREIYHVDQLELKESPQMTATEVMIRNELMQRLLGPTAGRLHSEMLEPLVFRVVALMDRAGQLPPVPDALLEAADAADIDIQFEGPLARAQRMNDLAAIERKNAWVGMQMQFGNAQVVDLFDWDEEGREVSKVVGVPANILLSDEQVAQIRQAKAEAKAAQEKMMAMAQGAESLGKAAPALKLMQPQTEGAAA